MKSNFSRSLHRTLSHSDVREGFTSSLSHSDLIGVSRSNQVANLSNLDYRVKPDNDGFCTGRSMVEMLGVLAIIGVLSVGAIAGYSKAMMKYKLNKHAEQMNTLINAVARNVHSFDNIKTGKNLTEIMVKMGEIPTEMVKGNNSAYIYDIFGQAWSVFIGSGSNHPVYLSTYNDWGSSSSSVLSSKSADNLAICRNMLITAKENSANIYVLATASGKLDNNRNVQVLYGDAHCGYGNTCLKNITLDDIYRICTSHTGASKSVVFEIVWIR